MLGIKCVNGLWVLSTDCGHIHTCVGGCHLQNGLDPNVCPMVSSQTYPWGNLLRPVLNLGKQVDQICYVLALRRCCPRSTQAAGGHHPSAARRLVLDANSTSLKQRRSVRPGDASRPSLTGQLFPHRPLQGAGAGETSRVQGTGELNPTLRYWSVN